VKELHHELGSEIIDRITIKAMEGLIQIISSRWGINEMLRVIDGLFRNGEIPNYNELQPQLVRELNITDKQTFISQK
jgi:hypothetical protein